MIFELLNRRHTVVYFNKTKERIIAFPKENYKLVVTEGTAKSKRLMKERLGR